MCPLTAICRLPPTHCLEQQSRLLVMATGGECGTKLHCVNVTIIMCHDECVGVECVKWGYLRISAMQRCGGCYFSSEAFDWGRVARHGSRPAPQTRWPILCCAAQQCHHIQCHTLLLYLAHHKINTMMLFNPKTILETWHDNDNVHLLIFTQLDLCIYWGLIFSNVLIWQVLPSKLCSFDGVKNAQKNRFHFYLDLWLRSTSPPSS